MRFLVHFSLGAVLPYIHLYQFIFFVRRERLLEPMEFTPRVWDVYVLCVTIIIVQLRLLSRDHDDNVVVR